MSKKEKAFQGRDPAAAAADRVVAFMRDGAPRTREEILEGAGVAPDQWPTVWGKWLRPYELLEQVAPGVYRLHDAPPVVDEAPEVFDLMAEIADGAEISVVDLGLPPDLLDGGSSSRAVAEAAEHAHRVAMGIPARLMGPPSVSKTASPVAVLQDHIDTTEREAAHQEETMPSDIQQTQVAVAESGELSIAPAQPSTAETPVAKASRQRPPGASRRDQDAVLHALAQSPTGRLTKAELIDLCQIPKGCWADTAASLTRARLVETDRTGLYWLPGRAPTAAEVMLGRIPAAGTAARKVFDVFLAHPGREFQAHMVAATVGMSEAVTRANLTTFKLRGLLSVPNPGTYVLAAEVVAAQQEVDRMRQNNGEAFFGLAAAPAPSEPPAPAQAEDQLCPDCGPETPSKACDICGPDAGEAPRTVHESPFWWLGWAGSPPPPMPGIEELADYIRNKKGLDEGSALALLDALKEGRTVVAAAERQADEWRAKAEGREEPRAAAPDALPPQEPPPPASERVRDVALHEWLAWADDTGGEQPPPLPGIDVLAEHIREEGFLDEMAALALLDALQEAQARAGSAERGIQSWAMALGRIRAAVREPLSSSPDVVASSVAAKIQAADERMGEEHLYLLTLAPAEPAERPINEIGPGFGAADAIARAALRFCRPESEIKAVPLPHSEVRVLLEIVNSVGAALRDAGIEVGKHWGHEGAVRRLSQHLSEARQRPRLWQVTPHAGECFYVEVPGDDSVRNVVGEQVSSWRARPVQVSDLTELQAERDQARREAESAKGLQVAAEQDAAEWRKKAEQPMPCFLAALGAREGANPFAAARALRLVARREMTPAEAMSYGLDLDAPSDERAAPPSFSFSEAPGRLMPPYLSLLERGRPFTARRDIGPEVAYRDALRHAQQAAHLSGLNTWLHDLEVLLQASACDALAGNPAEACLQLRHLAAVASAAAAAIKQGDIPMVASWTWERPLPDITVRVAPPSTPPDPAPASKAGPVAELRHHLESTVAELRRQLTTRSDEADDALDRADELAAELATIAKALDLPATAAPEIVVRVLKSRLGRFGRSMDLLLAKIRELAADRAEIDARQALAEMESVVSFGAPSPAAPTAPPTAPRSTAPLASQKGRGA